MANSLSNSIDQLLLDLPARTPDYDPAKYILSQSNLSAIETARAWYSSGDPAMAVCGPGQSGKTHLAHFLRHEFGGVFAAIDAAAAETTRTHIVFVDGMPPADKVSFVGEFEKNITVGIRMVLIGEGYPGDWAGGLKDLKTRMEALPRAVLAEPDESLNRAVIQKSFP